MRKSPLLRSTIRMFNASLIAIALTLATTPTPAGTINDVDPFIGVDHYGEMLPAAGTPYGFVWLGPDMLDSPGTTGYTSNLPIVGFSHTHVMGTGGGSKYGNFRFMPVSGPVDLKHLAAPYSNESAAPGFYGVTLKQKGNVTVELTSSPFVGFHRYSFPPKEPAHVVLDVGSMILPGRRSTPVQTALRVIAPNRIEGTAVITGGWNPLPYTLHFSATFDKPFTSFQLFKRGVKAGAYDDIQLQNDITEDTGQYMGVVLDFPAGSVVKAKVGVSFVDASRARASSEREIPDWNFEATRKRAEDRWSEVLGLIEIEGATPEQRRIFYSALYRMHIMPRDLTGEHNFWKSSEPFYTDFYCIWDTFRTYHPLLTLIEPQRQRGIIRSLIDTYRHTGWMPEAFIAGNHGMVQGGSNADVVIADAVVKKLGGFDMRTAYEALKKNAEVDSPWPLYYGRDLGEWKSKGYLTTLTGRSVSRTMEYAYNDFSVSQVASALGKTAEAALYRKRSQGWENLWDPETLSVRPKEANGAFMTPYDRTKFTAGFHDPYYEGNGWQYATFVPHDVQSLINKTGGDKGFVAWLDEFFDKGIFAVWNEPDFLSPYLFIHAGRQDRTAAVVRKIIQTEFKSTRDGIPGNDDAGATSSWYLWGAMGIYPNAGQPYYYIGSPQFPRIVLHLEHGKRFIVQAPLVSNERPYVQSAKLNGKPWKQATIPHDLLVKGGTLELEMGANPSSFGADAKRPPSLTLPAISTQAPR
jgi:predicted alpha-1,2-mannosidase